MKQQKQKYTNSNKDPTGATELVYYGLMCDTKLLDHKSYPIPNGQTPALTSPPALRGSSQKGTRGIIAQWGTRRLRRGGGIPLWTLGWVTGFDPEENPLPEIALSPGHGAPVSRGGQCSPGETSPPREKGPTGPMRHGEATGPRRADWEVGLRNPTQALKR